MQIQARLQELASQLQSDQEELAKVRAAVDRKIKSASSKVNFSHAALDSFLDALANNKRQEILLFVHANKRVESEDEFYTPNGSWFNHTKDFCLSLSDDMTHPNTIQVIDESDGEVVGFFSYGFLELDFSALSEKIAEEKQELERQRDEKAFESLRVKLGKEVYK